ncbi:MAG: S26 family signal peptidase [Spirochaetales bacterium]
MSRFKEADAIVRKTIGTSAALPVLLLGISSVVSFLYALLSLNLVMIVVGAGAMSLTFMVFYQMAERVTTRGEFVKLDYAVTNAFVTYGNIGNFVLQSIALILAWSNSVVGIGLYYVLYVVVPGLLIAIIVAKRPYSSKDNKVKMGLLEPVKKRNRTKLVSRSALGGIGGSILSWLDAFVWAATVVIFINSLLFQIYQIPSESMVPEHYVGSRVFVVKPFTNPEIPLSLVRIPVTGGIDRFDQYVINNPRYNLSKTAVLREYLINGIFMLSFSLINIPKTDADGRIMFDPLIKRLIALPGEQIVMADDVIYLRDDVNEAFAVLEGDAQHSWNFVNEQAVNMARLEYLAVNQEARAQMLAWDREKRALLDTYEADMRAKLNRLEATDLTAIASDSVVAVGDFTPFQIATQRNAARASLLNQGLIEDHLQLLATDPEQFVSLARDYAFEAYDAVSDSVSALTPYERSAFQAELLFKAKLLDVLVAGAESLSSGDSSDYRNSYNELIDYARTYIDFYFDRRNFRPFPEDSTLAAGEYFFLGDNRYNSLDSRQWNPQPVGRRLFDLDPYSLVYSSVNDPFSIDERLIRGKALFAVN